MTKPAPNADAKAIATEVDPRSRSIIKLKSNIEVEVKGDTTAVWATLARLDIVQADFQGGTYRDLLLAGIDFTSASLIDADFSGCDFTGALLSALVSNRAVFRDAIFKGTKLDSVNIIESDAAGATFEDVDGNIVQAIGSVLDGASFLRGKFTGSRFDGASFKKAKLKETAFANKCNMTSTDFTGATLNEVEFSDTDLSHARFVGAKLRRCKFHQVDLSNVDFTNVDFKGSEFGGCIFTGMTLKGAKNIPQNIDQCGSTKVVDVLIRRAAALGNESPYMGAAFSKLWFQHLTSGEDLMQQPFEDVMDAALALADSMEGQAKTSRASRGY